MSKRATVLCSVAMAAISVSAAAANGCSQPAVRDSAKDVVLDAEVTRIRLPLSEDALRSETQLVLRDIRFDAHPGTQFHVVLEVPGDAVARARVGTLSFYMPMPADAPIHRTFDVTEELRQIAGSRPALDHVDVVFEATSGRGGANARTAFDPRSKLTIGAIELRVATK